MKIKITLLLVLGFIIKANSFFSQTDTTIAWKKGAVVNLNFSQASFNNWNAGGQNNIAINTLFSTFANYKKGTTTWDNNLDLAYGIIKQDTAKKFIKSDDRIELNSKFGKYAFKNY